MAKALSVLLTTEGTYPFHRGGVSTWCDALVKRQETVEYTIYSILMNPFVKQKFDLPADTRLIRVPLWGTEEPSAHLAKPFSEIYEAKRRTGVRVIRQEFLPLFEEFVRELLAPVKNGVSLARVLYRMHQYFQVYDYKETFKSLPVWSLFKELILRPERHGLEQPLPLPRMFDLIQSMGWLYRFFVILNTPVPNIDVSHSAAAAFCGIPCILAKMENRTPYLLTEHGVYLREQYISAARQNLSDYAKGFLLNMVTSVVQLSYDLADQVSPVCEFNTRWERELGVPRERIRVIYNGVDADAFTDDFANPRPSTVPTVVAVARIDPVKDIESLIRAAALVRDTIPEVKFIVYGTVSVPAYYDQCLALRASLGLQDTFIFAGHTDDVAAAYRSGHVVALASVSEAFPYSVVEAMMSGKAVVATDVGGVREAVEGCGLVVRPRRPDELAGALVKLLRDPELRFKLGQEGREKALNYFTIARMIDRYLGSYRDLYDRRHGRVATTARKRQILHAQRGYALAGAGFWSEAVEQFRRAVEADPGSAATPVLLGELARGYNELGRGDLAVHYLVKAEVLAYHLETTSVA